MQANGSRNIRREKPNELEIFLREGARLSVAEEPRRSEIGLVPLEWCNDPRRHRKCEMRLERCLTQVAGIENACIAAEHALFEPTISALGRARLGTTVAR